MNDFRIVKRDNFLNEEYTYIKHKSGLDIYIIPKKLSTTYALFGVKYGSVHSRIKFDGAADFVTVPDGIAHFLEHKMFENADGRDAFELYAEVGASANAYTSFNMTAYLFSCTDNFEESLEVLIKTVTKPYFSQATVDKEQGIIGQEIEMGNDSPGRALLYGMLRSMYKNNKIRIEIAGTKESISHIDSDLLYKCYNTFYNLNNMALCICGDVNEDAVVECADRLLEKAPEFKAVVEADEEPDEVISPRFTKAMAVSKPQFAVGVKDNDISSDPLERMKKSAAVSVLSYMLFGPSSDFYNDLYTEGVITGNLDAWNEHCKDYSFISISGEADDPEEFYRRFLGYMDETFENGLDKEEFELAKRVIYSGMVKSFDSTEEIANNFLVYKFDGGDMFEYASVLGSLDINETFDVFRKLFRKEHYTLAIITPIGDGENDD
ncbi:MAG: insulinase family protein [Clostridia bacterium]|nr:insulinase family protein [Clostridia bacterium]